MRISDLLGKIKKSLTDDEGLFQRGSLQLTPRVVSPIPKSQMLQPQQPQNTTIDALKKAITDSMATAGKALGNYFDPMKSGTKGFWGTPFAKGLGKIQEDMVSVSQMPRIRLPRFQVKDNPLLQVASDLGMGISESVVNIPRNFVVGTTRIGRELGESFAEKKAPSAVRLLQGAAPLGEAIFDITTLGGGKVAKSMLQESIKDAMLKQVGKAAMKQGKKGAVIGGLAGLGYSLDTSYEKPLDKKDLVFTTLTGATVGGALGGTLGGLGESIGLIKAIYKKHHPQATPQEINQAPFAYFDNWVQRYRNRLGRFTRKTDETERKIPIKRGGEIVDYITLKQGGAKAEKIDRSKPTLIKQGDKVIGIMKRDKDGSFKDIEWINEVDEALKKQFQDKGLGLSIRTPTSEEKAFVEKSLVTAQDSMDPTRLFQDWVNQRRASKIEGLLKSKEFADLATKGFEGIKEFQAGNKQGRFQAVKKYFDEKFKELTEHGVDMSYKKDYLPQLWENSEEEIEKVFGRKLSTKPSFTLESIFKTYEEGIAAGLTPRYKTIPELIGWYEQKANKALADTKFFQTLADSGLIGTKSNVPSSWIPLDPKSFPIKRIKTAEGVHSGVFYAPPELASMINNYLREPDPRSAELLIQQIADYTSSAKNRLLSFGIPGTGINFHGFNILARSYLDAGPKGALKTAYYMVNPDAAGKYVEEHLKIAPEAVKSGLSLSTADYLSPLERETQPLLSQFGKTWNELFEKPLFEKILTAKKLEGWQRVAKEYASFLPEEQAKKEAAKIINTIYGGINWEEMGRDRNLQNLFRIAALTPDWLESNIRLGAGIGKALLSPTDPLGKAYRRAMTNLVGAYIGLSLINKLTSGHFMFENDPGHTFEIEAGYTKDGQKRYIRPFGTAVDFVRIPVDVTISLLKGDPRPAFRAVANRLSPIVSPVIHLLANTNWAGQPIYGKDRYGKPMPPLQQGLNVASELGTALGVPSFLGQFARGLTGQQGLEQTLTQGFEMPVRYQGGFFTESDQPIAEALGVTGKERYDLAKLLKEQPPFSANQIQAIQSEGKDVLSQIISKREEDRKINKASSQVQKDQTEAVVDHYYIFFDKDRQTVRKIDLAFQPTPPTLTGNANLDKEALQRFNSAINKKANDIYDLYKLGKISEDEAEKQLEYLSQLKDYYKSIRSSGGGRKIRTVRIKQARIKSAQPIKIARKISLPSSSTRRKIRIRVRKLKEVKI